MRIDYNPPYSAELESLYSPTYTARPHSKYLYLDIETYPNFFSVCTKYNDQYHTYELSMRKDEVLALGNDLQMLLSDGVTIVTYNGYRFDVPILNYLFTKTRTPKQLKDFGQDLITGEKKAKRWIYNKKCMFADNHLDLMRAFGTKDRVSLKRIGIHLKYPNLVTLPYHHTRALSPTEMDNVLEYNQHDVAITELLHQKQAGRYEMTAKVSEQFGVDVYQENDTNIAKEIFKVKLIEVGYTDFKPNTQRDSVRLVDCLPDIEFNLPEFKQLYRELKSITLDITKKEKLKKVVELGGISYEIGIGGLHGYDDKKHHLTYQTTDTHTITDGDVTSYYPCLEMEHNIYPEHIGSQLLPIIRDIFTQRRESKALRGESEYHKVREYALKIAMNSGFGLMGEKHSFLYDMRAFLSVTMHGQIFLLKWVEMLHEANIKIISANTDGITVWLADSDKEKYYKIADEWMELTNLNLEFESFQKMALRNVNNYTALSDSGKVKDKGAFLTKKRLTQDPSSLIINKAAVAHLLYNTAIEKTVNGCTDIHEFIITKKNGEGWVLHVDNKPQQKVNRYYASLEGSYFYSHDMTSVTTNDTLFGDAQDVGRMRAEIKGQHLTLANDTADHEDCSNVDREWYINEAYKIINNFKRGIGELKKKETKPRQSRLGFS